MESKLKIGGKKMNQIKQNDLASRQDAYISMQLEGQLPKHKCLGLVKAPC
ncbi:MAG: hypothetical protein LC660_06220 [Desulfobacteraceae bacterium]|nr:hypothetical protein [Desulfobacteraceae bacterium]